jgi:hypothetical protein
VGFAVLIAGAQATSQRLKKIKQATLVESGYKGIGLLFIAISLAFLVGVATMGTFIVYFFEKNGDEKMGT